MKIKLEIKDSAFKTPRVEKMGDEPFYSKGDIIKTKEGNIGAIYEATGGYDENEECYSLPSYSVRNIKGHPFNEKVAWWHSSEWSGVILKPRIKL